MKLRDYQQNIYDQIVSSNTDVVYQLDTGAGKTPILTKIAAKKPSICIAHRNMLVEQISATLSKNGINHQIIATTMIKKRCQLVQRNHGVQHTGLVYVGTVQSISSRFKRGMLDMPCDAIEQVIIDEAHHVADQNMWAKMRGIFKNARFIGATATPCRLDGQGMHKDCGGLFDQLIQADELTKNATQKLIAKGYLSDYEYWCPPSDGIALEKLMRSESSDFTIQSIQDAINKELIAGDILKNYKKLANGKRNLIYSASIMNAEYIAKIFKENGYSATYIASSLSLAENVRRIDAFRSGEVTVLINVEMVTEGFDLPEIECVQIVRPTASFGLYRQMCGRNLRPKKNGGKAIFIDHVANAVRHGLPDDDVEWTLFGTPKNKSEPVIPCFYCSNTFNTYLKKCPKCGNDNRLLNRSDENDPLIVAEVIDIDLVKRVRSHWRQLDIEEIQKGLHLEREHKIKTEFLEYRWDYANNSIGKLCKKISEWFVENLKVTNLSIHDINMITQDHSINQNFWMSNFTVRDLNKSKPKKCLKVYKKWQSK